MRIIINRIGLILLGLFFITLNFECCKAQNTKLDSLQNLLKIHSKKDTVRVNLLNEIAEKYYATNLDVSLKFATEAIELANVNNYQIGKAKGLRLKGICYLVRGDYGNSLNNFKKSLSNYKKLDNSKGIADVLNNIGSLYYYRQDSLPLAAVFYNEAMRIYSTLNDSIRVVGTLTNIGNIHWVKGNYFKALDNYQQALKYTEQMGVEDQVARNLGNMGLIYTRLGDYAKSKEYFERSMKINEKLGDNRGLISNYRDIGGVYEKLGKDSLVLKFYRKALDLCEELGNTKNKAYTLVSLGTIYQKLRHFDLAKKKTEEALSIGQQIGDKWVIGSAYLSLASIYYDLEDYDNALSYLLKGKKNADKRGQLNQQSDACVLLAKIYSKRKNYKKAYEYHIQYKTLSDSVFNESNVKELTNLENQYDFEKEKQAIALEQEKKDAIQREELYRQREMRNAFIIGFIFVLFSVIIISYYYRKTKKANHQLSKQNFIITKQKEEKDWLLKEIHHRVKNNLQIISSLFNLQKRTTQHEEVKSALVDGLSRVKSVALIHQLLYQTEDVINVNFNDFVGKLLEHIKSSFDSHTRMEQHINIDADVKFHIDTTVPLGLIITELITNAYKYAFDKEEACYLKISLSKQEENRYCLTLSDNGEGMPEGFDVKDSKTLGLKMVRTLSAQLKGRVDYEYDNGAKFVLLFSTNNH